MSSTNQVRDLFEVLDDRHARSFTLVATQMPAEDWHSRFPDATLADAKGHLQRLDEHLRRRLRQLVWKQWKTPVNRYRNLRVRGVTEFWAIRAGGTSKGYWRLSASPPIQKAMDNAFWEDIGLVGFFKRYQAFRST